MCGAIYIQQYVLPPKSEPTPSAVTVAEPTPEPEPPSPTIEYTLFPRAAVSVKGGVVGVTGGEGEETLLSCYRLGGYTLAIVKTDSDGLDYRATAPTLAVAKFDKSLSLVGTVTLPTGGDFLCATPYEYGLLLLVAREGALDVVAVDGGLSLSTRTLPYSVNAACAVSGEDGVVVAASGERMHFFGLSGELSLTFSHSVVSDGYQIHSLYAYAGQYISFAKGLTDGRAHVWSSNGVVGRYDVARPDAITPASYGFALATVSERVTLYRYDYHLSYLGSTPLDHALFVSLGSYDGGVWAVLKQTSSTVGYTVCRHGDVQSKVELPFGTPSTPIWNGDHFLYWSDGEEGDLVSYVPLTNKATTLLTMVGASRVEWWKAGGTVYVACDSDFDYGFFAPHIGKRDVFIVQITL